MNIFSLYNKFLLIVLLSLWTALGFAQVGNYRDIKYPTLPDFSIPKPQVYTLKNGLQVFLMEDHELPLIQASALIRTGSNYEPSDKVGLAGLMGAVQRSGGTLAQTGDQIDDFLAARAASIETGIGDDSGSASMNCLKQDFDDVFKVFVQILRTPAFAQDKLDVAKIAENTDIARRNDSVGGITSREMTRLVYGPDSPLARLTEYATIGAVSRDDLLAWHKLYYQPNNILLGVVGDFDPTEMRRKLEAAFGDWPTAPAFVPPPVPYRHQPAPGYYFIEKSDVNQANIAFGHLGIETRNPDYFAVQVLNEVLGGGFSSRMFSNVRSKKGLAYSVYGSLGSDYSHPGLFRAGLQTKSATAVKAIEAVRAEIEGIIQNPATELELKRAKDAILNSFVFNYDSKHKILFQQMTYAFYGLPADFLEQYRANIEKVTTADVARVARQYLHPEQLAILVVGRSADFDQPLSSLGKVTAVDITIPPPPDNVRKSQKTATSVEEGKKAWARVVKAMGGAALKKTQAMHSTARLELLMGGQTNTLNQETTLAFPDKVRQVITSPMGEQTVIINGERGFVLAGGKVQDLPDSAIQENRKDQAHSLQYLLRYYDDPGLQISAADQESFAGASCQVLELSFKGVDSRLWVGPDGTVLKQSYGGTNPVTRAPGTVENLLMDYRREGELLVPHQQHRTVDGQIMMRITIGSFEINPRISSNFFQRPTL